MCCGVGVPFVKYTAEIEYPSSPFGYTVKSVAVCHAFSPPYYPADSVNGLATVYRVPLVEIPGQAVQIDQPAMPGIHIPHLTCSAEPPNVGRGQTIDFGCFLYRGHSGILYRVAHPFTSKIGCFCVVSFAVAASYHDPFQIARWTKSNGKLFP